MTCHALLRRGSVLAGRSIGSSLQGQGVVEARVTREVSIAEEQARRLIEGRSLFEQLKRTQGLDTVRDKKLTDAKDTIRISVLDGAIDGRGRKSRI